MHSLLFIHMHKNSLLESLFEIVLVGIVVLVAYPKGV
jgi:hypothetical protein